jgi:diguanylate cyclase (GGDEF)-like protein/PAS domain S-box-containing protein
MGMQLTAEESATLYRLLADNTTDVILKTDRDGIVVHVSDAIAGLALAVPAQMTGRHISELARPAGTATLSAAHDATIAGRAVAGWTEFPASTADGEERWFAIQMQGLRDKHGTIYGAVSIMRSIEERRSFEDKLFTAAMTDPLTGLTNRRAFIAMLQHLVDSKAEGSLALFDIDHFKAINMQYGQSIGDEVLVIFSDLLRVSMRSEDIISRIGSESWAVLLPAADADQAEEMCQLVITTLSEISRATGASGLHVTASAGVAHIAKSLDSTIKRAELALFLAKAKGRNRLEMDGDARFPWSAERRSG